MFDSHPSPLPDATLDLPVTGVGLRGNTLREELADGPVLFSFLRHFG